mgnify:CR=1 FL=1
MATMTPLQYLDTTDSGGADLGAAVSNRRTVERFIAGAAIVAGDVVMLDVSQTGAAKVVYVRQAGVVGTGNPLAIGVALEAAAAAGDQLDVVIAGYVEGVNCTAGTVTAGAAVEAGTTAGEVSDAVAADFPVFGVALTAKAANKCNLWIYRKF